MEIVWWWDQQGSNLLPLRCQCISNNTLFFNYNNNNTALNPLQLWSNDIVVKIQITKHYRRFILTNLIKYKNKKTRGAQMDEFPWSDYLLFPDFIHSIPVERIIHLRSALHCDVILL